MVSNVRECRFFMDTPFFGTQGKNSVDAIPRTAGQVWHPNSVPFRVQFRKEHAIISCDGVAGIISKVRIGVAHRQIQE